MDYAHSEGIVHRDVKPANLLIRPDGRVKITDFGIARIESQAVTKTGLTLGTPGYMSPEQIMSAKVGGQADQFSLGVLAFQMLSGRRPFEGDTAHALMYQIVSVEPPPLHVVNPAIPAAVSAVVGRALAKKPEDRFPNCKQFTGQLAETLRAPAQQDRDAIQTGTVQTAAADTAVPRPNRRLLFAAAAIVAALCLAAVVWIKRPPKALPVEPAAKADSGAPPVSIAPKEPETKAVKPPPGAPRASALPSGPPSAPAVPARSEPQPVQAGATKVNPKDGLTYAWIPPGTFQMGCSPGDAVCRPEESPRHLVRLTRGFWMGQTEVTVEAWSRFAKATLREMPREPMEGRLALNPGWAQRQFPMDNISWSESKSYCAWAGGRLPTEAQWEYAARAGSTEPRYGPVNEISWHAYNSGDQRIDFAAIPQREYQQRMEQNGNRVHTVATKRPNAWGLYDMLGNVNEWVSDWPSEKYYQESPEVDPAGPETGKLHIWRGGNYSRPAPASRASERGLNFNDTPSPRTGCRCTLYGIPATPNP